MAFEISQNVIKKAVNEEYKKWQMNGQKWAKVVETEKMADTK